MFSKIAIIIVIVSTGAAFKPFDIEKSVGWQTLRTSAAMALTLR